MAKYQSSSSGDESSEEDTSGEGGSTAAFGDGKQEARSTFRRSQPSKIERPVSSSHLDDSSSSSDAGAPSPSPPSPSSPPDQLPAPPTPSSTAQSWAWDPNAGRLISVTRHTTTLALETLTFPAGSYLGEISPADAPRANLFLKAQRCVSGCELRKSELDRPWRMRTHFVGCEKRKADFARRGEQDVLARLFGLQLQGMAYVYTRA